MWMQTASSKIWTRIAVSISYDVNHYTTNAANMKEYIDVSLDILHMRWSPMTKPL